MVLMVLKKRWSMALAVLCAAALTVLGQERNRREPDDSIPSPDPPVQFTESPIEVANVDATSFIGVDAARARYRVEGDGLAVAVLDTGLRTTHVDFKNRVRSPHNFTGDNGGKEEDVTDGNGHGTNVAGIIAAA